MHRFSQHRTCNDIVLSSPREITSATSMLVLYSAFISLERVLRCRYITVEVAHVDRVCKLSCHNQSASRCSQHRCHHSSHIQ